MKTTTPRLNRLVARYYPAVFRLAATLSNSPAEALALTRRAFEHAAQQLPRFRSDDEINFLLLASLSDAATPKAA
jgi:DNA-directed RNA polymerase specialized sigma24 family protein